MLNHGNPASALILFPEDCSAINRLEPWALEMLMHAESLRALWCSAVVIRSVARADGRGLTDERG